MVKVNRRGQRQSGRRRRPYHVAMPDRDSAEPERRAKSPWRTGRPSRWRAKSDARLRQQEGLGADEPDVIGEFLQERAGLIDAVSDDRDDD
jgi:hypothetical protein